MKRSRAKPPVTHPDPRIEALERQVFEAAYRRSGDSTAAARRRREARLEPHRDPYALPEGLLDEELKILGELSDVAAMLAKHMRERGVPEDDPDLMMVEAKRRNFAKNAAWVLSERAREAEERAAWVKASKARVMARVRALSLPKPDVAEDPTTIH